MFPVTTNPCACDAEFGEETLLWCQKWRTDYIYFLFIPKKVDNLSLIRWGMFFYSEYDRYWYEGFWWLRGPRGIHGPSWILNLCMIFVSVALCDVGFHSTFGLITKSFWTENRTYSVFILNTTARFPVSSLSTIAVCDGSGFGKRVSLGCFPNFFFAIGTKKST